MKLNILFDNLQEFVEHLKQLQKIGQVGFRSKDRIIIVKINWEVLEYAPRKAKKQKQR